MVVEHNVTGEMCHAVRMVTSFLFKGEQRPAGDIVILGPGRRQVVTPSQFEYLYAEIEVGPDGCAETRQPEEAQV